MTRYTSFEPTVELNGKTALAFLTNLMHDDMLPILDKYGLAHISPDEWYPIQSVLNVLSEIAQQLDSTSSFVSIGIAAANHGIQTLPPAAQDMPVATFFEQYEKIYQTRHRGGDSGYMQVEQRSDHHIIIRAHNPYPDDLNYGVIYGYTRHFLNKAGKGFVLKYDESAPRREQGGHETILHIVIDQ